MNANSTSVTAQQVARALREEYSIGHGDRIGILGDVETLLPVYHAIGLLGACAVPLDIGTLTNTQTLQAANAIYLIAEEGKLARAVRAVEMGPNEPLGAPNCREVIQFDGEAGDVFGHLASLAAQHPDQALESVVNWDQGEAADLAKADVLLLCLYFMEKVQLFVYTRADLQEFARRRQTEDKPKMRPKFSALTFYPVADDLVRVLGEA